MSETILRRDPSTARVFDPRVPRAKLLVRSVWQALYGTAARGEALAMFGWPR